MKADIKKFLIVILLMLFTKFAQANSEIKIGLLAPFSGEFASIGESVFGSARIAVNKINNNMISILPRDTKGNNFETLKRVEE